MTRNLTYAEKNEIINYKKNNQKSTQQEIANVFSARLKLKICRRTISDILSSKTKISSTINTNKNLKMKSIKTPKYKNLEEVLFLWIKQKEENNFTINEEILRSKVVEFARKMSIVDFTPSNGFLVRFKRRYGLS